MTSGAAEYSSGALSNFLLHPSSFFTGSVELWKQLEGSPRRDSINQMIFDNKALKRASLQGARFRDEFVTQMEADFPPSRISLMHDLAFDPGGTIRQSFEAWRTSSALLKDVPLRPEEINSRALRETINQPQFGLTDSSTENDLKSGTPERMFFDRIRFRLDFETKREKKNSDSAEAVEHWKHMMLGEIESTRMRNLQVLLHGIANQMGGVSFESEAKISPDRIPELTWESLNAANEIGGVQQKSLAGRFASFFGKWLRGGFNFNDMQVQKLFKVAHFKGMQKNTSKKVDDVTQDGNFQFRITDPKSPEKPLFEGTLAKFLDGLLNRYKDTEQHNLFRRQRGKVSFLDRYVEEAMHREDTLSTLKTEIEGMRGLAPELFKVRLQKATTKPDLLSPTAKTLAKTQIKGRLQDAADGLEWSGHAKLDGHWENRDSLANPKRTFTLAEGPSQTAPSRLVRKGWQMVPGILRAGVLWTAMNLSIGGGAGYALYKISPDYFKSDKLASFVSEVEMKEMPSTVALNSQGPKVKDADLFQIVPLKNHDLKEIPQQFDYALKGQTLGSSLPEQPSSHVNEGDFKVEGLIPTKPDDNGAVTIPTPRDAKLRGVRLRNGEGRIVPNEEFLVMQNPQTGILFVRPLKGEFRKDEESSYKVDASFNLPNPAEIEYDPTVHNISPELVLEKAENFKKLGFEQLAANMERFVADKKEKGEPILLQELTMEMGNAHGILKEGSSPPNLIRPTSALYGDYLPFLRNGRLILNPIQGNQFMNLFLRDLYRNDRSVKVTTVPVLIREEDSNTLKVQRLSVQNVVSVGQPDEAPFKVKRWGIDGTPTQKEPLVTYISKAPEHYDWPDWMLPLRDDEKWKKQKEEEAKKKEPTEEEHKGRLKALQDIRKEISDVLQGKDTPPPKNKAVVNYKPQARVSIGAVGQLITANLFQYTSALEHYSSGKISQEEFIDRAKKAFPKIALPEGEDLLESHKAIQQHVQETVDKYATFVVKERKKGDMAIYAYPGFQKAIAKLIDHLVKTDWTPRPPESCVSAIVDKIANATP